MKNVRLVAAVAFALVAAAGGALAWGLNAPAVGAVAAVAGIAAATVASISLASASDEDTAGRARPPVRSLPARAVPGGGKRDAAPEAPAAPAEPEAGELPPGLDVPAPTPGEQANELVDSLTGMLDHRYFIVALERRVSASRRKLSPFSLVVLELEPEDPRRHRVTDQSMKVLAAVVRAVLRESDTGCRLDEHTIGVLLEDTPEAGAVWAIERVRAGFFATTFRGNVRLAAGIAAYPAHALEADQLLAAAREAAAVSREKGDESIELAAADEAPDGGG